MATSSMIEETSQRRERGYWKEFSNLEKEILQFIEQHGESGKFPAKYELRKHNRQNLIHGIKLHGGPAVVAQKMKLVYISKKLGQKTWKDAEVIRAELISASQELGIPGVMPSLEELRRIGKNTLGSAISNRGGFAAVADQLDLEYRFRPSSTEVYWHEWANVEKEIRGYVQRHNLNRLPRKTDLIASGDHHLKCAIRYFGGLLKVAERMGLNPDLKVPPSWLGETNNNEQKIDFLLTLVNEGKLSVPEMMIILNRANLLDQNESKDANNRKLPSLNNIKNPQEIRELAETKNGLIEEEEVFGVLSLLEKMNIPLDKSLSRLAIKLLWESSYHQMKQWQEKINAGEEITQAEIYSNIENLSPGIQTSSYLETITNQFAQEVIDAWHSNLQLRKNPSWSGCPLWLYQTYAASRVAEAITARGKDSKNAFILLADEPGVGKTATFLAAVLLSGIQSVLIVAPKQVADTTWSNQGGEIRKFLPGANIVRGIKAAAEHNGEGRTFYILHYEELLNDTNLAQLSHKRFDCLCLDEAHYIKHREGYAESQRRRSVANLRSLSGSAVGLTGTPLVNDLSELVSIMQILSNGDTRFEFQKLKSSDLSHQVTLFEACLPFMIRRRKEQVLSDLPPVNIFQTKIEVDPSSFFGHKNTHFATRCNFNLEFQQERKFALEAKLHHINNRVKEDKKFLILTYLQEDFSTRVYRTLTEQYGSKVGCIDGTTSQQEREELISSFKADDGIRILIGTIRTIGTGLTLFDPKSSDTAHEIIVADLPYTNAEFEQGIARLHRQGQKHPVNVDVPVVVFPSANGKENTVVSIDERVWDVIHKKKELSDKVVDGRFDSRRAVRLSKMGIRTRKTQPSPVIWTGLTM